MRISRFQSTGVGHQASVGNAEIAATLYRLGELLEIEGANPFRVRAYRNAARVVEGHPQDIAAMVARGEDLSELPGIGKDLAGKIGEIVNTGHLALLDQVEKRVPGELAALARLPGLGPKRIKLMYERLRIDSLDKLERAARAGKLRSLPGFGAKTEQKLLNEILRRSTRANRIKLAVAERSAEPLLAWLRDLPGVMQAEIAGSYRRRAETVGDIDILVSARKPAVVIERFVDYDQTGEVLARGSTRAALRLRSGLQVDLRVVGDTSFGAAMQYFTGNKAHNIALRQRARQNGLKVNEYGVFRAKLRIAGKTETEVYAALGLPLIPPELRENRGEIEAALSQRLPRLIALDQIRGDLHVHTDATDGIHSLAEMAAGARALGYDYVAIADHSRRVTVAHGLDSRRLAAQIRAIDALNHRLEGVRVLKSCEVDILEDGRLDLPDKVLAELDLVIGAVHSNFNLARERQTERVIRAMDHSCFTIFAHPSGRLIGERAAYDIDMERVMVEAKARGCFLEVNGHPDRLDLDDRHCLLAKEIGLKLAISTDAHSVAALGDMRHGVDQARRGWLEAKDVINTRSLSALGTLLRR